MKKLTTKFLALALLALVYSSCSDDDNGPSGKFTLDGESFKLSRGFAFLDDTDVIDDDTYYGWGIVLTSSGINYSETEEDFTGEGDAVTLIIYALNDDSFLPAGTYNYNEETADSNGIYVGFDSEDETAGDSYNDIDDVSVTITKSGSTYTITFTITLADETVITGSYKGVVKEIED